MELNLSNARLCQLYGVLFILTCLYWVVFVHTTPSISNPTPPVLVNCMPLSINATESESEYGGGDEAVEGRDVDDSAAHVNCTEDAEMTMDAVNCTDEAAAASNCTDEPAGSISIISKREHHRTWLRSSAMAGTLLILWAGAMSFFYYAGFKKCITNLPTDNSRHIMKFTWWAFHIIASGFTVLRFFDLFSGQLELSAVLLLTVMSFILSKAGGKKVAKHVFQSPDSPVQPDQIGVPFLLPRPPEPFDRFGVVSLVTCMRKTDLRNANERHV